MRTPAKRLGYIGAVALCAAALAGCTQNTGNRANGGALLGAALGGLTGSHFGKGHGRMAAIAVGTIVGASLGHSIGRELDQADRRRAERNAQRALEHNPTGQASEWANPDTGHSGSFTPTRTYGTTAGAYCREYRQTIQVGGRTVEGFGTACRQPDGSWQIVDRT